MTDQPNPCRTTRHCADYGFCHRCAPKLADAARHLIAAINEAGIPATLSGAAYYRLAVPLRDAARQATGQQAAAECPQCDDTGACNGGPCAHPAAVFCPTPETHNWGCGCPTDKWPAASARSSIAAHMATQGNDPTLALLLNRYHEAVARQAVAEHVAAAGQPATQQQTEAHPPKERWRVEAWDADRWVPATVNISIREVALNRLALRRRDIPDTQFRLVRETTTWTVEADEAAQ